MKKKLMLLTAAVLGLATSFLFTLPFNAQDIAPEQIAIDCITSDQENIINLGSTQVEATQYYVFKTQPSDPAKGEFNKQLVSVHKGNCQLLSGSPSYALRFADYVEQETANVLAVLWWEQRQQDMGGLKQVQQFIESSKMTGPTGLELTREDLHALQEIGVKVPRFIRPVEDFKREIDYLKYYSEIYTEEWEKKHQSDHHHEACPDGETQTDAC